MKGCGSRRSGATAVELMVVLTITLLLVVSLSLAISRSLSFHQRGREEAFIRESLCLVLEKLAESLEMANGIDDLGDGRWRARFRMETGGVSFETNRFVHVSGTEYYAENWEALHAITHGNGRAEVAMSGDAKLDVFLGLIDDVLIAGSGSVRQLEIHAKHPVVERGVATTNTIIASRPFRLWNQTPSP